LFGFGRSRNSMHAHMRGCTVDLTTKQMHNK
jgi:hypothetical protein